MNRLRLAYPLPVYFLFAESFIMNMGFFMLIPMLSIHYMALGLSPLFVGNLYAVRILSQQGLQLFGGLISDRYPTRWVIFVGTLIRALGFGLFAVMAPSPALFLAAVCFGIGGALFGPAGNAALAELTPVETRSRAFTIRQATSNIGTTVGPAVGAVLVEHHFALVCWLAGGMFAAAGFAGVFLLPDRRISARRPVMRQGLQAVVRDRVFLRFVLLFMGYYVIYQQMYIAVPAILTQLHAPKALLGELFSLEAVIEIAVSYPVIAWMARRKPFWTTPRLMGLGLVIMGASWLPLVFRLGLWGILSALIGLSLGSVISLPNRQTYISELADETYMATYFGVASLSMAFGASVGASGGGLLMHVFPGTEGPVASVPSLLFSAVAIGCGFLLARLPAAALQNDSEAHIGGV